MNVDYSDSITNTVKTLRENVYCKEEFKEELANKLSSSVGATETTFVPEQFGGWSVNLTIDKEKSSEFGIESQTSTSYIGKITDALTKSIHTVDKSISCSNIGFNLVNVVITGSDSISIKL